MSSPASAGPSSPPGGAAEGREEGQVVRSAPTGSAGPAKDLASSSLTTGSPVPELLGRWSRIIGLIADDPQNAAPPPSRLQSLRHLRTAKATRASPRSRHIVQMAPSSGAAHRPPPKHAPVETGTAFSFPATSDMPEGAATSAKAPVIKSEPASADKPAPPSNGRAPGPAAMIKISDDLFMSTDATQLSAEDVGYRHEDHRPSSHRLWNYLPRLDSLMPRIYGLLKSPSARFVQLQDQLVAREAEAEQEIRDFEQQLREREQRQREAERLAELERQQREAAAQQKLRRPLPKVVRLNAEQSSDVHRRVWTRQGGVLASRFNVDITRQDVLTLKGTSWLNDEVINFYGQLIMERAGNAQAHGLPSVHWFSTFFYSTLAKDGYARVRRWTRRVDIFSKDLLLVPVHLGMHWCMAAVHFPDRRIIYMDSLGARNDECLDLLLMYLDQESRDKKGTPFDVTDWETECLSAIPRQKNGYDCGVFACSFAECLSRGIGFDGRFNFTQADIPAVRERMAYEIAHCRLLEG
ncbi:sentrin-specific protease 1 [Fonticula alba]|uniref:Sentrin-specific protease 1 n=1 Tax=Fonticula alba TaxID=691883 RepID=A0A058ZBW5_FONAL|nr:sentrin-specific protease 1 [Fonticula alba]KCV71421.1 sentrin-specific protease 1 [Fonticula alba]|eukprot:XP_009494544.1 sentrin-specific protease 1 [Fonticula alba]